MRPRPWPPFAAPVGLNSTSGPVSRSSQGENPLQPPLKTRAARFPGPLDRCVVAGDLGHVVADVLELAAKEDHGHDHGDGDNGDDECIFDEALTLFVTEESDHLNLLSLPAQRANKSRPPRETL